MKIGRKNGKWSTSYTTTLCSTAIIGTYLLWTEATGNTKLNWNWINPFIGRSSAFRNAGTW